MQYLRGFKTEDEALARNEVYWNRRLGRAKNPEDVTRYRYNLVEDSRGSGYALEIDSEEELLDQSERDKLEDSLDRTVVVIR